MKDFSDFFAIHLFFTLPLLDQGPGAYPWFHDRKRPVNFLGGGDFPIWSPSIQILRDRTRILTTFFAYFSFLKTPLVVRDYYFDDFFGYFVLFADSSCPGRQLVWPL